MDIISALPFYYALSMYMMLISQASSNHVKLSRLTAINWGLPLAAHKLNVSVPLATGRVKTRFQCMSQCTKTKDCVAINFGPNVAGEHVCEKLKEDRYTLFFNMTVQPDWTYVGIKSKCDSNPCPSGKNCMPRDQNNYVCVGVDVATCVDYKNDGWTDSGVVSLVLNNKRFSGYCDQTTDGGGWLVIQRNDVTDASLFDTNYREYQDGFGNLQSNFWWGNEKIHQWTKTSQFELRVDLKKKPNGQATHARYTGFKVSNSDDGYRLQYDADSYSGTAGDSLKIHNGMKFSTPDKDQDEAPGNCARERNSGWWYQFCAHVALNKVPITWKDNGATIFSEMKIRPLT